MARDLGLFERYSLARSNIDCAPILAFYTRLQSPCSIEELDLAIAALLARYPLLRCSVANSRTPHPTFNLKEFGLDQILHVDESECALEEALLKLLQDGYHFDVEQGPLWKVIRFGPTSIGLCIHHVIADGSGSRSLFAEFLQLLRSPGNPSVFEGELPSNPDATVDIRPSWSQLLSTVFSELVLPRLPAFVRPAPSPPSFPNPTSVLPFLCQPRLLPLALPSSIIPRIKAAGKAHNVNTLHPILYTAVLSALRVAAASEPGQILFKSDTPLSERSTALGHPRATGNYLSSIRDERWMTTETPFWPTCRSYAALLSDPYQRAQGRGLVGMLAYIPDGVVEPDSKGRARTGWEVFLEKQRDGFEYGKSFEVSNLGVMEETEPAEIYWAQTPHASFGAAVTVNVVSTRDGALTMTIGWREGVFEEKYVRDVVQAIERILRVIGKEEMEDDASIGMLSQCTSS